MSMTLLSAQAKLVFPLQPLFFFSFIHRLPALSSLRWTPRSSRRRSWTWPPASCPPPPSARLASSASRRRSSHRLGRGRASWPPAPSFSLLHTFFLFFKHSSFSPSSASFSLLHNRWLFLRISSDFLEIPLL